MNTLNTIEKKYDVFGLGSALIDCVVKVEDSQLATLNLEKGITHFIDDERQQMILPIISQLNPKIVPAGSCANTMMTLAMLGSSAAFCGKLGSDEHARLYEEKFTNSGAESKLVKTEGITGSCTCLITEDAERTMITHLGANSTLSEADIDEQAIKQSKYLYVEGYLLESPNTKQAALHAMQLAKKHKTQVALDVSDSALVSRHLDELQAIIKNFVDVLFANSQEVKALTGREGDPAFRKIPCQTVVIKQGEKGSIVKQGEYIVRIRPVKAKAVDTTGAGDAYAAGFLHMLCKGKDIEEAGNFASMLAAKITEQYGATFENGINISFQNSKP